MVMPISAEGYEMTDEFNRKFNVKDEIQEYPCGQGMDEETYGTEVGLQLNQPASNYFQSIHPNTTMSFGNPNANLFALGQNSSNTHISHIGAATPPTNMQQNYHLQTNYNHTSMLIRSTSNHESSDVSTYSINIDRTQSNMEQTLPVSIEVITRLFSSAQEGLPAYLDNKSDSTKSRMQSTIQYSDTLLTILKSIKATKGNGLSLPSPDLLKNLYAFAQSLSCSIDPRVHTSQHALLHEKLRVAQRDPAIARQWAALAGTLDGINVYMQWPGCRKNRNHYPKYNKVSVPHVWQALGYVTDKSRLPSFIMESLSKVPLMGTWPLLDFFYLPETKDPESLIQKLYQWIAGILVYGHSLESTSNGMQFSSQKRPRPASNAHDASSQLSEPSKQARID